MQSNPAVALVRVILQQWGSTTLQYTRWLVSDVFMFDHQLLISLAEVRGV